MRISRQSRRAFTLVELLVVLGIVLILAATLSSTDRNRDVEWSNAMHRCQSNLKDIGIAWEMYAVAHNERLPRELPTNSTDPVKSLFLLLTNYTSDNPKLFVCPADKRKPGMSLSNLTDNNLSYFVGLTGSLRQQPRVDWPLLGGERTLAGGTWEGKVMSFDSSTALFWTNGLHKKAGKEPEFGTVLFLDGHVESLNDTGIKATTRSGGTNIQRLIFPK